MGGRRGVEGGGGEGKKEERGIKGRRVYEFWSMPGGRGGGKNQRQHTEIKRTYFPAGLRENTDAGDLASLFLSLPILCSLLLCLMKAD